MAVFLCGYAYVTLVGLKWVYNLLDTWGFVIKQTLSSAHPGVWHNGYYNVLSCVYWSVSISKADSKPFQVKTSLSLYQGLLIFYIIFIGILYLNVQHFSQLCLYQMCSINKLDFIWLLLYSNLSVIVIGTEAGEHGFGALT